MFEVINDLTDEQREKVLSLLTEALDQIRVSLDASVSKSGGNHHRDQEHLRVNPFMRPSARV